MSGFEEVMEKMGEIDDENEKGEKFETLAKSYLQSLNKFSIVQKYSEWAEKSGRSPTDNGIDLVATLSNNSEFCAIQCKFRKSPDDTLTLDDIDTFLEESKDEAFSQFMLIDTTRVNLNKEVNDKIDQVGKDFERKNYDILKQSVFDWKKTYENLST